MVPDARLIRGFLVALATVGFVAILAAFNASKPRILVLQAAEKGTPWAAGVDRGIRAVLATNRRPVSVAWHWLGLTRTLSPQGRASAVASARRAIASFDPDVLMAIDDEANAAVAQDYAQAGRPRVVYVSIDRLPEAYGYGPGANATGIVERLPLAAVCDALSAIRVGQQLRIAAVGAANDTGQAELAQVESFDWGPHTLVAVRAATDTVDWRRFVETDAAPADVLLVLSYAGLDGPDGRPVDERELANWVEDSARPLPIGLHAGYVFDGGGFAISPPPVSTGRLAMTLALALLDSPSGHATDLPPPALPDHFDVAVNRRRLAQRQVKLPPIYLEAARAAGNLVDESSPMALPKAR